MEASSVHISVVGWEKKHILMTDAKCVIIWNSRMIFWSNDLFYLKIAFKEALPSFIVRCMLILMSLNHPGTSTLQPYTPASILWAFTMVRETSPSNTRPSSWYLGDCLKSTAFPREDSMGLEHLVSGTLLCPQQTLRMPSVWASYKQGKVMLCPVKPVTFGVSKETGKTSVQKTNSTV